MGLVQETKFRKQCILVIDEDEMERIYSAAVFLSYAFTKTVHSFFASFVAFSVSSLVFSKYNKSSSAVIVKGDKVSKPGHPRQRRGRVGRVGHLRNPLIAVVVCCV